MAAQLVYYMLAIIFGMVFGIPVLRSVESRRTKDRSRVTIVRPIEALSTRCSPGCML